MAHIFISYSHKNSDFTDRLRTDLEYNGFSVWRDKEDIRGGENWDEVLETILYDGGISHFVPALSGASYESEMVRNEIALAADLRIRIIPAMIEACRVPLRIYRRQRVDFRADYHKGLSKLVEEIGKTSEPLTLIVPPSPARAAIHAPTTHQLNAARDESQQVWVVAGPGTGKSFVIEERVRWLLEDKHVTPETLHVVSFTRNASRDLHERIVNYCKAKEVSGAGAVRVSTLHSLALKALRKAGQLLYYPVDPRVMDRWELENIFDQEFSCELKLSTPSFDLTTPGRCKEIRLAHEAFWCTGRWNPPDYIQPKNPVTERELEAFNAFNEPTSQVYACILPGEIVKKCVDGINAGTLSPVSLLKISHFIADEFQDLNYTDIEFVKNIIASRIPTCVAGDDDQSVYSFRFAYPTGIQQFPDDYPSAGKHMLDQCFRSATNILETAKTLIEKHSGRNRIKKSLYSKYEKSTPRVDGMFHRWKFKSASAEAAAIANSCQRMVDRGIKPEDILILISNSDVQLPTLRESFEKVAVKAEMAEEEPYIKTNDGRFVYGLVRIACDLNLEDYIAHRLILGLSKGVGIQTCYNIRSKVLNASRINYLDVFYHPLPEGMFNAREQKALAKARAVCNSLEDWREDDLIIDRTDAIHEMVTEIFGEDAGESWREYISGLPDFFTLKELRDFLSANTDAERLKILEFAYQKAEAELPEEGFFPPKVRIMTMHSVKGLDAQIVFIPGLEEDILPGPHRRPYPGLVEEAARMLYVAITRAKAVCVMSYAWGRSVHGGWIPNRTPSRFCASLGGAFADRDDTGFSTIEAEHAAAIIETMQQINSAESTD